MKKYLVIASLALFTIAVASPLSSFAKNEEPKKKEIKAAAKKTLATVVRLYNKATGLWQSTDPGVSCGLNGQWCKIIYNDANLHPSRTPGQIIADATAAWGTNLAGAPTSGTVQVADGFGIGGTITVTIEEQAP